LKVTEEKCGIDNKGAFCSEVEKELVELTNKE
jgi:hypothetical protein